MSIFRRAEVFVLAEVFRDVRMQTNLRLMFERKAKISCKMADEPESDSRPHADVSENRLPPEKRDFH